MTSFSKKRTASELSELWAKRHKFTVAGQYDSRIYSIHNIRIGRILTYIELINRDLNVYSMTRHNAHSYNIHNKHYLILPTPVRISSIYYKEEDIIKHFMQIIDNTHTVIEEQSITTETILAVVYHILIDIAKTKITKKNKAKIRNLKYAYMRYHKQLLLERGK
jgi:hypothetical protein